MKRAVVQSASYVYIYKIKFAQPYKAFSQTNGNLELTTRCKEKLFYFSFVEHNLWSILNVICMHKSQTTSISFLSFIRYSRDIRCDLSHIKVRWTIREKRKEEDLKILHSSVFLLYSRLCVGKS